MRTDEKLRALHENGYCVLKAHFARNIIDACRHAFWPILLTYLKDHGHEPNRGPHRHFVAMPFETPCYAPAFFFDSTLLQMLRETMDDHIVADQWGCDTPLSGSTYQKFHADYQCPLFPEAPDLALPTYTLVVSFGLVDINEDNGPIEIAPGTHRIPRARAIRLLEAGELQSNTVPLKIGDVLIRHPWTLHRGTPNTTDVPRAMVTVRYVRRWYADASREVNEIPSALWKGLTREQQELMRFPIEAS